MNIKSLFSIQETFRKAVCCLQMMARLRRLSLTEFAKDAGLEIVYFKNRPANFPGYLDKHEESRFIVVNLDSPVDERAWFIAQQVAFFAQRRGCISLALDSKWKWDMLAAAPEELKSKILAMDQELRAYGFMLLFSSREEYRPFVKKNRKRISKITLADNIVRFYLYRLWLKIWLAKLYRRLVFIQNPVS